MRAFMLTAALCLLSSAASWGVPRYSAAYNQSCILCHVDPSGGGARALYGAQFFAYTELATKPLDFEEISKVQPLLNDQVQIGFDARTLFFGSDEPEANSFMQMQGDLYLIFQLSDQWTFYLDKGLYSNFEIWGMGHFLPYNGYVKAGRFTPPYGLRLADHKAFVRDKLDMKYGWQETGLEVGFHPERFTLAAAVTNGSTGFQDGDEAKAVTGRADVRLPVGDLLLWVGATGRRNEVQGDEDLIGGGYGGLALGRFSLLGEVDYRELGPKKSLVSFAQVGFQVYRGITITVEHDFLEPDLDYESGAENMYLLGAEFVPLGFLELIPNIRYHDIEPGSDVDSEEDYFEGELQFHLFF